MMVPQTGNSMIACLGSTNTNVAVRVCQCVNHRSAGVNRKST